MHYIPDSDEADSEAEAFWPEGYKQVIREDLRRLLGERLRQGKRLRHVHRRQYAERYPELEQFVDRLADMVAIGAENGADDAFEDVTAAFARETPLPEDMQYARYLLPRAFSRELKSKLRQVVVKEYGQDKIYSYAYKVGYHDDYPSLEAFLERVAEIVTTGAMNGADGMLEGIYRSFLTPAPLPPARRYPRRLRSVIDRQPHEPHPDHPHEHEGHEHQHSD